MKTKLKQVLLVDDSPSDNFIHKRCIEKAGIAEKIVIKLNGREALDYLITAREDNTYEQPELIFLDINMPVMNGWEFLDEYAQLMEEQKARNVLAMLTTSTAPRDRARARDYDQLSVFIEKPLTVEDLHSIMRRDFADYYGEEE